MDLSIFGKVFIVFRCMFSSFLNIELIIISFLLFTLLLLTFKYKNRGFKILLCAIYIYSFFTIVFCNLSYVSYCIDSFFKIIMNYIYFPSTVIYFFIMIFVIVLLIRSINSKIITKFKRIFNYSVFSFLILLYTLFLSVVINNSMNLADKVSLYKNNDILSIVQVSNLVFVFWVVYSLFYMLFRFFQKNFDKKIEN